MRRITTTTAAVLAAMTTMLPIAVSTASATTAADDSAHMAAAASSDHRPEPLRLKCEARLSEDVAGARCVWSAPISDAAAGVRLLRVAIGFDAGREVVFRTTDLSVTEHVDTPIRTGVRYAYAVIAVNDVGRIVGRSRTVVTGVRASEPPTVEPLRLDCAAGSSGIAERNRVGCEWSLPTTPARALTLWRSVDDGARERVASFGSPFAASNRDVVPAGTTSVVYAVIATDGDGEIVARSRADRVDIAIPPTTVPVRLPTSEPTLTPTSSLAPATTEQPVPTSVATPSSVTTFPETTSPVATIPATTRPTTTVNDTTRLAPVPTRPVASTPAIDRSSGRTERGASD